MICITCFRGWIRGTPHNIQVDAAPHLATPRGSVRDLLWTDDLLTDRDLSNKVCRCYQALRKSYCRYRLSTVDRDLSEVC